MLTIHDLSKEVDMTAVRGGISLVGQVAATASLQQNGGDFDRRRRCDRDDEERHGDCDRDRHEGWHRRDEQKFDIASCGYQG